MQEYAPVLDQGYVKFIESWGSDQRIVESARMSTHKGFEGWGMPHDVECPLFHEPLKKKPCPRCGGRRGDEGLLSYLWEHKHASPFEQAGMTIEIQAPIFVFREWHRHRTQSYNELSGRYTVIPDFNYMPTVERCMVVNGTNTQANGIDGAEPLTHEAVLDWLSDLEASYLLAEQVYQKGLRIGIPKEVARCPVPVARYSRMRASANLRNWLAFCTLRKGADAQWEIRQYADVAGSMIESLFPRVWSIYSSASR